MTISNWSIGAKIVTAFLLVVMILGGASIYLIDQMQTLGELQDTGAKRAAEAVEIGEVSSRCQGVYAVAADGVINRDLSKS